MHVWDLAHCSKSQTFSSCAPVLSLLLFRRKSGPNSPLWTATCSQVMLGQVLLFLSVLFSSEFLVNKATGPAHRYARPSSLSSLGQTSAPLLREFLCGLQTVALVLVGPALHTCPKITQSLTVRTVYPLLEPQTVCDRVSLWIFPGWHWEEACSCIVTQRGGRDPAPSRLFSLRPACSCGAISGAYPQGLLLLLW